ncbi:MAG: FecR domain-containing protein [Bacteroidota bacterium]
MSEQTNYTELNQRIKDLAARIKVPATKTAGQVWFEVSSQLTAETELSQFSSWLKVAASVVLVASSSYLFYKGQDVKVVTARAQQLEVTLPDNSKVLLNAESTLAYNKFSWRASRSLQFEGEGFFQIQKGSAFAVHSTQGATRVLGTSFNIYARKNDYQVSCSSGRVRVEYADHQDSKILTAGLETCNINGNLQVRSFEQAKTLGWQKGEFYFEAEPLHNVFATIERQYNVRLSFQQIDVSRRYTGFFTNQDIDETMKIVCLPMGLNYQIVNAHQIKIYKEQDV